jgi:beta-lactamase class A
VTQSHVGEGSLPLADLCSAAIEVSDNTAANLLLRLVGGPTGLTRFLRRQGDRITRLDRTEPSLNTNLPGDVRDTTTPNAMVRTMAHLLVEDGLPPQGRQRLVGWMRDCQTGRQRLRAGVPADWQAGDKTGTGSHGAVNDCAIFWPPGRPPFVVAAYLSGSVAEPAMLDAAHARLGHLVAASLA